MGSIRAANANPNELSFSSLVVAGCFFLVLSQFLTIYAPEIVTQLFRPIIVVTLELKIFKDNLRISSPTRILTLLYIVHSIVIAFLSRDDFMLAGAYILYSMMLFSASGVVWNARELRTIITMIFVGCFVCAVLLLYSNPIDDFSAPALLNFLGAKVNRNRNAYAFSLGTLIGLVYIVKGKNVPKVIIAIMTAVLFYALLYSQSRGAFFGFAVSLIVFLLLYLWQLKTRDGKNILIYVVLIAVVGFLFYVWLVNSPLNRLIDVESTSGRDSGIENAWDMFLTADSFEKAFGRGFSYEMQHADGAGAHLVYMQYLVACGIWGATLIVLIFVSVLKRCQGGDISFPLAVLGIMRTFFEGLDYYVYIPLILSLMVANYHLYSFAPESSLFVRNSHRQHVLS